MSKDKTNLQCYIEIFAGEIPFRIKVQAEMEEPTPIDYVAIALPIITKHYEDLKGQSIVFDEKRTNVIIE